MTIRAKRWLAWSSVSLYLFLATAGLWLQAQAGEAWMPALSYAEMAVLSAALGIWSVVGALIVSRHSRNPIGWILCAIPLAAGSDPFSFGYASYDLRVFPGALPGGDLMVAWTAVSGGGMLAIILLVFLFLLFPDGRPLSDRWLLPAWICITAAALAAPVRAFRPGPLQDYPILTNPFGVDGTEWAALGFLQGLAVAAALLSLLAASLSLVVRFRRAQGDERQQIKWLAYTAAFWPAGILLVFFSSSSIIERSAWALQSITIVGLPAATAIAIFKYRLYDIDLIIRRTLSYSILTVVLALVYFLGIVLLQTLFAGLFGGDESPLITVISTLTIAALFNPLRGWIQDFLDRRFFRSKYDAEKALTDFAAVTRDEVDLGRLSSHLLSVVEDTMQPVQTSLWLQDSAAGR